MTMFIQFVTMVGTLSYVTHALHHFIVSVSVCRTSLMVTGFVHHAVVGFAATTKIKGLRMENFLLALNVNLNIMLSARKIKQKMNQEYIWKIGSVEKSVKGYLKASRIYWESRF